MIMMVLIINDIDDNGDNDDYDGINCINYIDDIDEFDDNDDKDDNDDDNNDDNDDFQILSVRLMKDEGGRLKGFGYADFEDRDSLIDALSLTDACVNNRQVFFLLNTSAQGQDPDPLDPQHFSFLDADPLKYANPRIGIQGTKYQPKTANKNLMLSSSKSNC